MEVSSQKTMIIKVEQTITSEHDLSKLWEGSVRSLALKAGVGYHTLIKAGKYRNLKWRDWEKIEPYLKPTKA